MPPQSGNETFFQPLSPSDCRKRWGKLPSSCPPHTVIFCYERAYLQEFLASSSYTVCDGSFSKLYFLTEYPGVAIGYFGIGAPLLASKMEELIAWGVQKFISVATAGALQKRLQPGDLVICDKAVRDETTSQNYLPRAKYIHAPRRMNNRIQTALKKLDRNFHIGSTWTTDSFYRQTEKEIELYQLEGILTIDREAAALFAVSHFYQVDLGVLFTITDFHKEALWQPRSEDHQIKANLHHAIELALSIAKET